MSLLASVLSSFLGGSSWAPYGSAVSESAPQAPAAPERAPQPGFRHGSMSLPQAGPEVASVAATDCLDRSLHKTASDGPRMTLPSPAEAPPTTVVTVDVRGETCPVPLIEARRALSRIAVGQRVHLIGTHDSSFNELPLLAKNLGASLVSRTGGPEAWEIIIERRR
ncbi:MAG: sulfurtransferase TusA family protein [Thermoplasmatota archaeon]